MASKGPGGGYRVTRIRLDVAGVAITAAIAIYAIRDVRREAKKIIKLAHDIAYLKLENDVTWLYVDPTENTYPSGVAKGLHEYQLFYEALHPSVDPEDIRTAVENEALEFADDLVHRKLAWWKAGLDPQKVRSKIQTWRSDKSKEKVRAMLHPQP